MIDGYGVAVCIPQYTILACVLAPVRIHRKIDCFYRRGVFFVLYVIVWSKNHSRQNKKSLEGGVVCFKTPNELLKFQRCLKNKHISQCMGMLFYKEFKNCHMKSSKQSYRTQTLGVLMPKEAIHLPKSYWVICVIDYVNKFVWSVELVELK